jgi:hypothetical protein
MEYSGIVLPGGILLSLSVIGCYNKMGTEEFILKKMLIDGDYKK